VFVPVGQLPALAKPDLMDLATCPAHEGLNRQFNVEMIRSTGGQC